jgi:uncharacterized membrane protein
MLSSAGYPPTSVENLRINVLWDGLFHAFTWLMTAVGLGLLWRAGRGGPASRSMRALVGPMLIGWGAFNLVEGIVDHHILGIHHVRPGPNELLWDLGFLAFGAVLVAVGVALARAERRRAMSGPIG